MLAPAIRASWGPAVARVTCQWTPPRTHPGRLKNRQEYIWRMVCAACAVHRELDMRTVLDGAKYGAKIAYAL